MKVFTILHGDIYEGFDVSFAFFKELDRDRFLDKLLFVDKMFKSVNDKYSSKFENGEFKKGDYRRIENIKKRLMREYSDDVRDLMGLYSIEKGELEVWGDCYGI